jgi:uncharacterized protein (TIGR03437 family)
MFKRVLAPCAACLVLAAAVLHAQEVFVSGGTNSNSNTVEALAINPLSTIAGFQAGAGTFLVFSKPDGSRIYTVAISTTQTVTSVDSTFQNPKNIASLPQPATGAAMAPNGKKLIVVGGSVHIIDTTTDTDIISSGINLGSGISALDAAVSLDGKTFYVLGTASNGSQLSAIDVGSSTVTATLGIQGIATGVSVGPDGLIYVSTANLVIQVDPTTFKPSPGGSIQMNAKPGRLVFTYDGQYALAVNQTPVTGSAVLLISLGNHAVVNTVPNFGIVLDVLYVTGTNKVLGYSNQNQSVYQLTIGSSGGLGITSYNVPGSSNATTAIAISNEVPAGGVNTVQSVFAVNAGVVYQLDPNSAQIKGQTPLPTETAAGALAFLAPAVTSGNATTLLQYGSGQTMALNSTSRPLVVQVLDANSHPLGGVTVTFSTNSTTSTLSATSVTTQNNGYALTHVNSGSVTGPVQVTAAAGTHNVAFTVNVGISTGGSAGGLTALAGQGQVLPEGNNTAGGISGSSLKVLVKDANGTPLPGAPVTFRISQGLGTLFVGGIGNTTVKVNSDANGVATCDFLAPALLDVVNSFAQTAVTASAPGTNTLTFYITTVPQTGGLALNIKQLQPQAGTILSGQAGTTLTGALMIAVSSITGVPIPNVGMTLSNGGLDPTLYPSAKCNDNGTGVLSNGAGVMTCDLVLGPKIGSINVFANVAYAVNMPSFTIKVSAGPPGIVKINQGNNQAGGPGQQLPQALVVHVSDSSGNTLAGTTVTWQVVTPGTVVLSNVITVTDLNGNASAIATLGSVAGIAQVKAIAGTASATFNLSVVVPSTGILKISGDNQTAQVNTPFGAPLVVEVVDATNKGVPGVQVNFQVTSGNATLGSLSASTDSNGQASIAVQASSTAGAVTVTASSNGFNVVFSLTVGQKAPTNLAIVNGASFNSNTGISPGGIAILSGNGILSGVQGLMMANNIVGPLPTVLGGASISFGDPVLAPIYYVMSSGGVDQVAIQVPFEVQPGTNVTITVNAAGGGSAPLVVTVQPLAPGIFSANFGGQIIAVAVRPDGSFVSPSNPALRGENITIYVTGLGQVGPATATGDAGIPGESQVVLASLVVGVNNSGVPIISAVYAPGMVGVYAVTFQVPANTTPGPAQPLGLIAHDAQNSDHFAQGISIPIQ